MWAAGETEPFARPAIAAARSPEDLVITQNIDGLQRRAGLAEAQLIEIHGRHDRFVCTREGACPGATEAIGVVEFAWNVPHRSATDEATAP